MWAAAIWSSGQRASGRKTLRHFFARWRPLPDFGKYRGRTLDKLVWNCALNAVSALGRAKYGQIASSADAWKVVETAVHEVLAVARAARIHPPGLEDPKARWLAR